MKIEIKKALLEGYTLEAIVEAVHANHPHLNKSRFKDKNLTYSAGKEIEKNRKSLATDIKSMRGLRDDLRKNAADGKGSEHNVRARTQEANLFDNNARARSQIGGEGSGRAVELKPFDFPEAIKIIQNAPRVISSAKQ